MSTKLGRRELLKISGPDLLPSGSQKSDSMLRMDQPSAALSNKPVRAWVTDDKRRLASVRDITWSNSAPGNASTVVVRPELKFQEMLGFGGAMTDAACWVFSQLPDRSRTSLFRSLFDPTELAFNVCRICIGSSDCSTSVFSYDEGDPDPDLRRFSIERDRGYVLPILREARSFNPDLFLFASPWSPPGWMKSNGSLLGGCMRHTYMASYASYFLEFLRSYQSERVPIQAVTIQNEVDADQDGTMPACAWPQDYEADFLTMHLGPLFQRAGIGTKIWIIDHNYNLWGRAIGELETPDVRKYTNAVAWHGYAGDPQWIRRVQNAFPEVEMYWTEGGPDFHSGDYTREWAKWGEKFTSIVRNCCRSLTVWTLASDENGRPYVGGSPTGLGGAMLIHSKTHEITYSGMFWALAHFSKFVRRGSTRIDSQGESAGLFHCAFENPDGSVTVVLTNQGAERPCELKLGTKIARVPFSSNSVTTLLLSDGEPAR